MHVEASDGAVMQTKDRVVDEQESARDWRRKFDHGRTARRNQRGLQTARRWRQQITLAVHLVKYLPDHVERRNQIGSGIAHEQPYGLVLRRDWRLILQQGAH